MITNFKEIRSDGLILDDDLKKEILNGLPIMKITKIEWEVNSEKFEYKNVNGLYVFVVNGGNYFSSIEHDQNHKERKLIIYDKYFTFYYSLPMNINFKDKLLIGQYMTAGTSRDLDDCIEAVFEGKPADFDIFIALKVIFDIRERKIVSLLPVRY